MTNTLKIHIDSPVYPCVYREHANRMEMINGKDGLSLCIQGTSIFRMLIFDFLRFIPVYTGNIKKFIMLLFINAVYPCVYREHLTLVLHQHIANGLSLCIQGTLRYQYLYMRQVRFIPVYTGNIQFIKWTVNNNSVYPCVYREHTWASTSAFELPGLSLCIQGTCCSRQCESKAYRFIPVYTGNIY